MHSGSLARTQLRSAVRCPAAGVRVPTRAPRLATLHRHRHTRWTPEEGVDKGAGTACSAASASQPSEPSNAGSAGAAQAADASAQEASKPGLWQRVKEYFLGSKAEKAKLAGLGAGAFASYSVISNATYGTCLTIAWISFVKATGQSPLAAGQWQPFLLVYAGFWTVQNFVRPFRFALAVALAPLFDRAITWVAAALRVPKGVGFFLLLMLQGFATAFLVGAALSAFGGFPDGIPWESLPFGKKPAAA